MYSMASWSPSQSDPLTVSYICQRQLSSCMLPSAAEMPPWAATVWERVGNTFVMQAGFAAADHGAQAGAAGADHDHVIAVIFDRIGFSVGGGTSIRGLAVAISRHGYTPDDSLRMA